MKIVPTLLTLDKFELMDQLELFQPFYNRIQIDVADGVLVPNVTTQIDELIELLEKDLIDIKPETVFDFHLMVRDFSKELEKIKEFQKYANINLVLINADLKVDISKLTEQYDFSIGLDISPKREILSSARQYDLDSIKAIQIMTVEPGFQGSPFLPDMLQKIQQLREFHYKHEILIDGGVNSDTIPTISEQKFKPDIICIGSYLTKAEEELEERVSNLKKL
ncbi:hypothetical protein COV58_01170 [Candidatus Roizmanbacteria bacterium CG11_big_fil_rev_8_21_14_0_20_36_8]|uniref:Ribulose-phosphate 3-epimerase n=2 Tax=Candidatus Roizmaniibacteriota TaxID=1752723 RepID=A0A2M6IUT2_9BACT|nr:MAG: hypothetical protein COV58_01170 [Candidatus Roizmanbacteria bacterium CG11_big_fil_rev_8_21_14_0_20_36_8]PIZ65639.1 MAG: hypothetical protein COY14_01925 [Candidatus Roizmanbacteria bacterium CG_4_10_14_0_2_um_filter_36_9]